MEDVPVSSLIAGRGASIIRNKLNSEGPKQFIPKLQRHLQIASLSPSAPHGLDFLTHIQVKRSEAHDSVLAGLRALLIEELAKPDLDQTRLRSLLEATFPYVSIEELRAIPVTIMQRLGDRGIPPAYLTQLAANPTVLDVLPLSLRKLAWERSPERFADAIKQSGLAGYVSDTFKFSPGSDVADILSASSSAADLIARLRTGSNPAALKSLSNLMENAPALVPSAYSFLRQSFAQSGHLGYCALRLELATHFSKTTTQERSKASDLLSQWCDAMVELVSWPEQTLLDQTFDKKLAVLQKKMEDSKSKASTSSSSGHGHGHSHGHSLRLLLLDAAMMTAHPLVVGRLLKETIKLLERCVADYSLPKDCAPLLRCIKLLSLAVVAPLLANGSITTFSDPTPEIKSRFLPALAERMVLTLLDTTEPVSEDMKRSLEYPACQQILLAYLIECANKSTVRRIAELLPLVIDFPLFDAHLHGLYLALKEAILYRKTDLLRAAKTEDVRLSEADVNVFLNKMAM